MFPNLFCVNEPVLSKHLPNVATGHKILSQSCHEAASNFVSSLKTVILTCVC